MYLTHLYFRPPSHLYFVVGRRLLVLGHPDQGPEVLRLLALVEGADVRLVLSLVLVDLLCQQSNRETRPERLIRWRVGNIQCNNKYSVETRKKKL